MHMGMHVIRMWDGLGIKFVCLTTSLQHFQMVLRHLTGLHSDQFSLSSFDLSACSWFWLLPS